MVSRLARMDRIRCAGTREAPLMMISLPAAAQVPALHGVHGALAPRGMRAVFGAAGGVGADAPPVDALEPRLCVERFEDGFVAAGLVGVCECTGRFVPGSAVGMGVAAETGFGEEHGAGEFFLDGFNRADEIGGGEVVGER